MTGALKPVKDLEKRTFATDILNLVKDIFLFCCYTGMAPIDAQRLEPHRINTGLDGIRWICYQRTKSKVSAYVPLLTRAVTLIEIYLLNKTNTPRNTIFPYVSNQLLNRNTKIIGEICQFDFPLNFYVSKYTYCKYPHLVSWRYDHIDTTNDGSSQNRKYVALCKT